MFSANKPFSVPYCSLCFSVKNLSRCARCYRAYYCSREHQVQHWAVHQKECKRSLPEETSVGVVSSSTDNISAKKLTSTEIFDVNQSLPSSSSSIQQPNYAFSNWCDSSLVTDGNGMNISQFQGGQNIKNIIDDDSRLAVDSSTGQELTGLSVSYQDGNKALFTENIYPSTSQGVLPVNYYNIPETTSNVCVIPSSSMETVVKLPEVSTTEYADILNSLSTVNDLQSSANNFWDWDVIDNCNSQDLGLTYNLEVPDLKSKKVIPSDINDFNYSQSQNLMENLNPTDVSSSSVVFNVPLKNICANIVHDLNQYGICVIDKFLGSKSGDLILQEVKGLFQKGIFRKGQLASSDSWQMNDNIRGDVITWVNGGEPYCTYIGQLVKKLDLVMATCNRMPNNGALSHYKLNTRTRAMIACYPGDGTHYMKHVDNPHGDGRCITCIYYLNKNWNTEVHGGLLRMFPENNDKEVANIEPLFDRMLFFWSDKRNPHEVLPSYDVRFAITVWYFDAKEREHALKVAAQRQMLKQKCL